jgi:hypothetical protein
MIAARSALAARRISRHRAGAVKRPKHKCSNCNRVSTTIFACLFDPKRNGLYTGQGFRFVIFFKRGGGSSPVTIVYRTQFSATAVLCGASIFAYPAIAWGVCAPATVDTGAPFVASNQLLEQVRQRREQQATVSMFSAAGSSPALKPRPSAAATKATRWRRFRTWLRKRQGGSERYVEATVVKVSTAPTAIGTMAPVPASTTATAAAPASKPRPSAAATEQYIPSGYSDSGY